MLLSVYGSNKIKKAVLSPEDSSTQVKAIQSDNILTLSFTLYEYVPLEVNDYIDYLGERYWLTERYQPHEKSTQEWAYDVKFYGLESLIKRFLVLNTTDGDTDPAFTLTAPPREHVALIVQSINDGFGTTEWKVGQVDGSDNIVIDYEGKYCDVGLKEIASQTGGEYWFDGTTVNVCRCEYGEEIILGYNKGLTELERDTADNVKLYTRLFPVGSSRNIDATKYGHSRLQLPGGLRYVDVNTDKYGIIHHFEKNAFTDIYPRRVGTVSEVRNEEAKDKEGKPFIVYYFKDASLNFDPNSYEIGLVKHVSFQEGSELAGLGNGDEHYFEVNYNSETKEFEIITIWPYDDDTQLPGATLVPKPGDKYILWNIRMPDEYYPAAEQELKEAVDKYNARHDIDVSVYKAPTDHVYVEENNVDLFIGRRVRLESVSYFPGIGYRSSRITKISRRVNLPSQMDLEISDALSTGALEKIGDEITDVKNYVRNTSSSQVSVVRSWEDTPASDYNVASYKMTLKQIAQRALSRLQQDEAQAYINFKRGLGVCDKLLNDILRVGDKDEPSNQSVYSSLRTNKEIEAAIEELDDKYLRKDIEDTARELIHFLKGIDVKDAGVFHSSVNSPDFASGFLNGKGWAILLREVLNAAGVKEKKSYAEFDEVTIRGALRVFEMIINQLKGEGDNSVFSGMMKVDHVDIANKKIYMDTGGGLLYNPFWSDDYLECQRYGGRPTAGNDYNITKHYELVVAGTGIGSEGDGENRLDWITYSSFSGSEDDIQKGDVLVRMDNLTNPDRKGIIMNTTVGAFAPYTDVLYGAKTDPGNSIKSRSGNLAGIYNMWFGWLKGFGQFIENLYAIGEFHFRNGENIETRLDMMENLFRVDMQNKTYNMSEEDNFLKNASFTENMQYWERENVIRAYTVNGKLLMFNRNLFAAKERVAGIVNLDGRNMLRIKNNGIRQANADVKKPEPTSILYLTFKFVCKSAGDLIVGFEQPAGSVSPEGSLPFVKETIQEGTETETRQYSGTWNGTGDFVFRFTGDIYIDVLALTNRPLDDFKVEVGTKFEQTSEKIALLGTKIDNTNGTVSNLGIELNAAKEDIRIWGEKVDKNKATLTQIGIDLDLAEEKLNLYANKTDDINNTVTSLGLRMNAAESKLELFARFEDKANGTLTNLGTRMNAAEGTIETYGQRINSLDGTVISLGSRMNTAEGTLSTYVNKTNQIDGSVTSLGTRMSAAERKFVNYVLTDSFTGVVGDINTTLSRHWSAIEQTDHNLLLSINKSTGYPINKDTKFLKGTNGISVYNNSGGSAVTVTRYETSANSGVFQLRVQKVAGSSSPGLGGFTFSTPTRINAVFEARFTANVPKGYTLNFASNATGNNGRTLWITDNVGAGDWKEYKFQVFCGGSGTFSTTNFFYLTRDNNTDTYNTVVTWYLKEATVFDLSGYEDPVTYINLTDNLAKIKAKRIEFEGLVTANNYFKILLDGSIEANKGTFKNVIVQGSIRSAFVQETDSIVIGGEQSTHDNVATISTGGGWITGGVLEWDTGQSGRRMCITNYRWGNQISEGAIQYTAPSGKYFFEDGVGKNSLTLSRECVELMGYGMSNQFYGWIVLNRINLMTNSRYGRKLNILAHGIVTGTSSGASISYKAFDGGTMTVSRTGTGIYRVNFPSAWGLTSGQYVVMLTGYGMVYESSTSPNKATLGETGTSYFIAHCSDDATRNDGSFMFQIANMNDWY